MRTSGVEHERQSRQCQSESGKADDQRAPKNRLQGIDLFRQFLDEFELLRQPLLHLRNACLERFFPCLGPCLLILEGRNGGETSGMLGATSLNKTLAMGHATGMISIVAFLPKKEKRFLLTLFRQPMNQPALVGFRFHDSIQSCI